MMTSIPWEDGWTVKVDGKKVEPVKLLNALVGIPLEAGEHEVTMTFTPPGWNIGLVCLVAGILILILFYRYDKKHNAVLLAIARQKRRDASDEDKKQNPKQTAVKSVAEKKVEKSSDAEKPSEKTTSKPPKQSNDEEAASPEKPDESASEIKDDSE